MSLGIKSFLTATVLFTAIMSNGADKLIGLLFAESVNKSNQAKFIKIQKDLHKKSFKLLKPEDFSKNLSECEIVISNKRMLSAAEIDALKKYVSNGGFLIAVGTFGHCIDKKYDSRGSLELSSCRIGTKNLSVIKLRVLGENPVFKNFFPEKWIDYPNRPPIATILQPTGNIIPLAIADFRPWGWFNDSFKYGYYGSRFQAKVGLYAGFISIGKGICLRISDDLLSKPPQLPLIKALWANLLEPDTFVALKKQEAELAKFEIYFDNGSMIPNGNFEKLCLSTGVEKINKNCATGNILMPQCWRFNSWKGKFAAQVINDPDKKDNHILQILCTDPGSQGGGSLWLCELDYIKLVPGKKYVLSIKAKGKNIYRADFGINIIYADGKRQTFSKKFPAGDFDWQDFNLELTVDRMKKLKRGFRVQLGLSGTGIIQTDDFILTEAE